MANAPGADILVATTTAAASCVNSVNTSSSDVSVSAASLFSRRQAGLPTVQLSCGVSQVQNMAPSLYLPLLPPHKVSPIRVDRLRKEASAHPDPWFVDYVLTGIQEGFHVGFNPALVSLRSARQNMLSASLQPSVIDDYLRAELAKGRVAGPFSTPPLPNLHVSRFGVIPKKHQPNKWRLILDLSHPEGHSVNDGVPRDPFSVQYMKVDDIIAGIMSFGRGALLANLTWRVHIALFRCIRMIATFWACSGEASTLLTWPYRLAYAQPHIYSRQ